jgi:hypothetical protein
VLSLTDKYVLVVLAIVSIISISNNQHQQYLNHHIRLNFPQHTHLATITSNSSSSISEDTFAYETYQQPTTTANMQSIFTIIASALVASNMANAAPAWNTTNSCNSSSVIACCNTNEISAPNSGILSQVLGGSCVLPNLLAREFQSLSFSLS